MSTDKKEQFNHHKMISYDGSDHSGRHQMYQHLQKWLDEQGSKIEAGYFIVVGIDRLSLFNEAFGTEYADALIEETGHHLKKILGRTARISRIGGDVYGALIHGTEREMPSMAQHILNSFYEMPLHTEMGPIRIGVSIGGIMLDNKGITPATILARAELALRAAKDQGRGRFISYLETAEQSRNYLSMIMTGDSFLRAMREGRVRLAFQPVMDSRTDEVSFYECLVRIIGEDGAVVNAAQFIPAVEELGLARVLDKFTLNMAIKELAMFPQLKLSVNVSNWSLTDLSWLEDIVETLHQVPDVASRLIIEITESVAIQDMQKTEYFVEILKGLGCRIALDDFGSGYTAFSQLKTLDIDIVKIDQSFIRDISEERNHLFVRALQSLAEGINLETVGEGAETQGEADILVQDGIDHIQGFIYGKPSIERLWLSEDHIYRKFPADAGLLDKALVSEREEDFAGAS